MNCLFCDLIKGIKTYHRNGLPFKILHETENTLSFLSIDIPSKIGTHVLVVPKKHYVSLGKVPKSIQHELIEHVSFMVKVLRTKYDGCNVLLNDGKAAKQCQMHVHVHIIPRIKGDNIEIEVWEHQKYTNKYFIKQCSIIKGLIKTYKKC